MNKARFLAPLFMFICGTIVALQLIAVISKIVPATTLFPETLSPDLATDIAIVMAIALPILFLEYVIFAVPIAVVILFITKIVKSTRYEMNIMNIGREFGGTQMVRRAAAPALFSVASAQLFIGPIRDFLFPAVEEISDPVFEALFNANLSLMGALLFVPIALLLFMPTWVLNDAGVVTHLKSDNLLSRQCPDTQGVGRWIANMLGGYALLAFPITMFISQFYEPIILPIIDGSNTLVIDAIILQAIVGLLWTIGIPFFVMAYVLPIVMFNEGMQARSTVRILRLAQRLGAKMVRKERIQEIKRLGSVYDEDKKATVELYAAATNREIVMTQKTIKSKDVSKSKGKNESKGKKKSKPKKSDTSAKASKKENMAPKKTKK
ncbi:MAG: hypothetical protein E4H14_02520 [Candidatus Thorarchaeota archaeon]|nr:MAG: hypothetical protein E4H14_02520 [Candidatus Thorarchaeota archaeon]